MKPEAVGFEAVFTGQMLCSLSAPVVHDLAVSVCFV